MNLSLLKTPLLKGLLYFHFFCLGSGIRAQSKVQPSRIGNNTQVIEPNKRVLSKALFTDTLLARKKKPLARNTNKTHPDTLNKTGKKPIYKKPLNATLKRAQPGSTLIYTPI